MEREEKIRRIETYLRGEISEEELMRTVSMESDEMEELRMQRYLREVISQDELLHFQKKLMEYRKKRRNPGSGNDLGEPRSSYALMAAAAAVTLLLAFVGWRGFSDYSDTVINREMSTVTMVSLGHFRGGGLVSDTLISMLARQESTEAMEYIRIHSDTASTEGKYLTGIVLFSMERWSQAARNFRMVIRQGDNLFLEDASYMLVMSRFQLHMKKEALTGLRILASREGPRGDDARRLLRELSPK